MKENELWRLIVSAVFVICVLSLLASIALAMRGMMIPSELVALVMSGLTGLMGIFRGPKEVSE